MCGLSSVPLSIGEIAASLDRDREPSGGQQRTSALRRALTDMCSGRGGGVGRGEVAAMPMVGRVPVGLGDGQV